MFFLALLTTVFLWQYLNQYLVGSKADASSITLSLIPSTFTFNNQEVKEFQLVAQFQNGSASEKISYFKARIDFPKDSLELPANEYVITTDSGLGRQIRVDGPVAANGSGQVVIELGAATSGAGPATNSQPVTIAKIKFKGKTPSSTGAITIQGVKIYNNSEAEITQITKNNATFSVGTGGANPTATVTPGGPTLTPTPIVAAGNAKLNLKLKFQGIVSQPAAALNKLNVKMKLLNTTTGQETDYKTAEFIATDTASEKGVWSGNTAFDVDVNAKYILYVKGPYHVQKKICVSTPTETAGGTYRCTKGDIGFVAGDNNLNLSGVLLLGGDLPDQDGSITAYDTSLIRNNLGKTDNDKCDVNRDGRCDTQDHSLIIESLSVKNDEL